MFSAHNQNPSIEIKIFKDSESAYTIMNWKSIFEKLRRKTNADRSEFPWAKSASEEWWRDVVARSIWRAITDVKEVLEPEIARTIAIESSIYGSKVLLEPQPK